MGITFSFAEKKWICFNDVIEGEYALLVIYLVCEGSSTPLATKALASSHCLQRYKDIHKTSMISKCISLSTNILRIYQINYWNLLREREEHKLVGANCLYILQINVQIFLTLK